jgi:hypothetical protein
MVRALYEDVRSCVRVAGKRSKWLSISRGIRQGCSLSCLLFVIYVNDLIKHLKDSGCGVMVKVNTEGKGEKSKVIKGNVEEKSEGNKTISKDEVEWMRSDKRWKCGMCLRKFKSFQAARVMLSSGVTVRQPRLYGRRKGGVGSVRCALDSSSHVGQLEFMLVSGARVLRLRRKIRMRIAYMSLRMISGK